MTWRTGTKNPHALYKDDLPAGFVRDATQARELCAAANAVAEMRAALEESVERSEEELHALTLARAIIDAHNENVKRHAAEVERLRAELASEKDLHVDQRHKRADAEAKLAAASALLKAVDDALENEGPWLALQMRIRAHLAGQTAAPPTFCISCGAPAYRGDHNEGCKLAGQTAAQCDEPNHDGYRDAARPCPGCDENPPTRTAAERRVLDAMAALTIRQDGDGHCAVPGIELEKPLRAELALREGK